MSAAFQIDPSRLEVERVSQMDNDIVLSRKQAGEALVLFTENVVAGSASNDDGRVILSKAVPLLRKAFEVIYLTEDSAEE